MRPDQEPPLGLTAERTSLEGNRTLWRRAAAAMPNILTLAAVLCGLTSLRLSGEGQFAWAMAAIFGAAVLDVADGFAARRLCAVSAIGAELDSLADFLNFGVAPAMLLYGQSLHLLGGAGWLIAAAYVLATGIRLARFNVQPACAGASAKKCFYGLPSTGAAVAVLIANSFANAAFQPGEASILAAGAVIAASVLMLSKIRVPSLQALLSRDGVFKQR
ncbi:MAG: CDP-alcohol phosphatidyltransferase family protein [Rhodomicrobium sp.]|nr:CDP-alcohol phosphatidyltransferase family protein [Rhodomicrobium sp.]